MGVFTEDLLLLPSFMAMAAMATARATPAAMTIAPTGRPMPVAEMAAPMDSSMATKAEPTVVTRVPIAARWWEGREQVVPRGLC